MDTQDSDKGYIELLDDFDQAVRAYEIYPTLIMNINGVKNTYRNYIFTKGKTELPKELKKKESDLVKRCGGLLNA